MTSLIVAGTLEFAPGARERWLERFAEVAQKVRAEPGCVAVFGAADPESSTRVVIFEHYRDLQAYDDHGAQPYVIRFRAENDEMGIGPVQRDLRRFDATERVAAPPTGR